MTENLPATIDAAMNHTDVTAVLGLMVPIVAIVMGVSVALLGMWLDYRKKREMFQLHHAERMAAIEKGIDLPPLPPGFFQGERKQEKTPYTYLRRGLMWLLIGVAATAALWGTHDTDFWWGLVPVAVGLAYLITFLFERGREPDSKKPQPPL